MDNLKEIVSRIEPVISLNYGIIEDCSEDSLKFFGFSDKGDLIGRRLEEFFPTKQCNGVNSVAHWNERIEKCREEGIQQFVWRFRRGHPTQITRVILINTNKKEIAIIRLDHSYDEEWEIVKEQQDLLLNINERIEEGIYRSTPEAGILYVNKAFVKMFGFESVDEILSMDLDELNALYDATNDRKRILNQIELNGCLKNQEVLFRRKDGSKFWGLESCFIHNGINGEKFIDGIIIDITSMKDSENLLIEKNNELQKINEELDRFVYSASHDLRAPLSSILGLLNLAELEQDPDQLQIFYKMMRRSIQKLNHFIREILDYSRNARLSMEDEHVDLEDLVNQAIEGIEYIEGSDKIRKAVKIYKKNDFVSDRKRVSIIISNLITNAVLYHDLRKENPFIEIEGFVENERVTIRVTDNGKGIDSIHLDRIFDMFYRASEDSKGSGLGLFMVKECVEKLQGTINVSSTVNQGSQFEIVLKNFLVNNNPKSHVGPAIA